MKIYYIIFISFMGFIVFFTSCEDIVEPSLHYIIPKQGYDVGGTDVKLYGDYFNKNASVYFGDNKATNVEFINSNEISVITPAGSQGIVDVRVKNSDGESVTLENAFTYYDKNITTLFFEGNSVYQTGENPGHIVIFDINQDGLKDIAVSQYFEGFISVFHNRGDGTFNEPTKIEATENIINMIGKDVNNDGNDDLIATSSYEGLLIFLNDGTGTFSKSHSYPTGNSPSGLLGADIDNDNDIDLVVANADWGASNGVNSHISTYKNNGDGSFDGKVDYDTGDFSNGVISFDIDNDGDSDLAVTRDKYLITLLNNGSGIFSDMVEYSYGFSNGAINNADIDKDGDQDIIILTSYNSSTSEAIILLNDGLGVFHNNGNYSIAAGVAGLLLIDLDNDDDIDLVAGSFTEGAISVRRNLGNGSFGELISYVAGSKANGPAYADLDDDGDLDIVCANGRPVNTLTILYNQLY